MEERKFWGYVWAVGEGIAIVCCLVVDGPVVLERLGSVGAFGLRSIAALLLEPAFLRIALVTIFYVAFALSVMRLIRWLCPFLADSFTESGVPIVATAQPNVSGEQYWNEQRIEEAHAAAAEARARAKEAREAAAQMRLRSTW